MNILTILWGQQSNYLFIYIETLSLSRLWAGLFLLKKCYIITFQTMASRPCFLTAFLLHLLHVIFIITGYSWYFICPWVTAGWAWSAWHQHRKVYPMRTWSFETITFSCHGYITQNIAYSLCPTKWPSLSFWSSNACKLALSCLERLVFVNQLQKRKKDHFVTLLMLVTLLFHVLFKLLVVGLSRLSIWHLRYRFTTQKYVLIYKAVYLSSSDWGRQRRSLMSI